MSTREFTDIFEPGEYGLRGGASFRGWHLKARLAREKAIGSHDEGQHIFNVYAGTGAGKTHYAGLCASTDLNLGRVRRVVVVVWSLAVLDRTREVFRDHFGIHLAPFVGGNAKTLRNGVTSDQQGYILTYAALARRPKTHHRISTYEPTLVIFDEVHHLGDKEIYGEAARRAFGEVPYVVTMTGSPFRPKSLGTITFADYVPSDQPGILEYVPSFAYNLGEAIAQGHCRVPRFHFCDDVTVDITPADSDKIIPVTYQDDLPETFARLRLQASVAHGSKSRIHFLRNALDQIKAEGRKCIIFLGGQTAKGYTPTSDATELLPVELASLGVEPDEILTVTKDTKDTHRLLTEFEASERQWILLTVNKISEGVDVPSLSAAIFLTTWTSDLSFIQRMGRVLRYRGQGDFPEARVYMFAHPASVEASLKITEEIDAAAAIREGASREYTGPGEPPAKPAQAVATGGGEFTFEIINGKRYHADVAGRARKYITDHGLSMAYFDELYRTMVKEKESDGDRFDRKRA